MSDRCFDEIASEVSGLSTGFWGRLAFAAACAERIFPFYLRYRNLKNLDIDFGMDPYISALDYIWICVGEMDFEEHKARQLLMVCEDVLPNEDEAWGTGCPYADDATAAVLYCLRFMLSGDQQEAIWAANRAYEVADNFVVNRTDHNIISRANELEILHHPIIQNELSRQLRDLQELHFSSTEINAFQSLCHNLRQRAKKEAVTFLNSGSSGVQ